MTYRELLEQIVEGYGYYARPSYDEDVDVVVMKEDRSKELLRDLKREGFKVSKMSTGLDIFEEWHVHSPLRADLWCPDRGWDWELGTRFVVK